MESIKQKILKLLIRCLSSLMPDANDYSRTVTILGITAKFAQERMNAIRALDQRIQSHADKTGRNQDFKSRAMSAAEENEH